MRRAAITVALTLCLAGCSDDDPAGPPAVHLGDSICDQCGMIISDERFAAATIVKGARGPEALLFDDFNCQHGYEADHADLAVERRWVHDHDDARWLPAADATFLASPRLHTPMASGVAAFRSDAAARRARDTLGGELLALDALRRHLDPD